jgi:hypothetical protein
MRCAPAAEGLAVGELLGRISVVGREATVNARGVTVAMPQGHSWAPHSSIDSVVNVGTIGGRPLCGAASIVVGRLVVG